MELRSKVLPSSMDAGDALDSDNDVNEISIGVFINLLLNQLEEQLK
jgi:hypothetical protein